MKGSFYNCEHLFSDIRTVVVLLLRIACAEPAAGQLSTARRKCMRMIKLFVYRLTHVHHTYTVKLTYHTPLKRFLIIKTVYKNILYRKCYIKI